jgi:hypothetical protein
MGKHKVIDFWFLYGATVSTIVGLWGLYLKMYWTGLGCLAMGIACFAFDRWARKRLGEE